MGRRSSAAAPCGVADNSPSCGIPRTPTAQIRSSGRFGLLPRPRQRQTGRKAGTQSQGPQCGSLVAEGTTYSLGFRPFARTRVHLGKAATTRGTTCILRGFPGASRRPASNFATRRKRWPMLRRNAITRRPRRHTRSSSSPATTAMGKSFPMTVSK